MGLKRTLTWSGSIDVMADPSVPKNSPSII